MNAGVISSRYAKALLMLVNDTGSGARVYRQICDILVMMNKMPEFRQFVQNHDDLTVDKKCELLSASLNASLEPDLDRFVRFVASKRRMEFLGRMFISFVDQYHSQNGIKVGKLQTAVRLEGVCEELEEKLCQKTGAEVHLLENINPDLIGGFVLEIDDYRVDASVEGQFRRFRHRLVEKTDRIV